MSPNRKEQWGIYCQQNVGKSRFVCRSDHNTKPYLYFTRGEASTEALACQRAVSTNTYYAKKFNPHEKPNEQ